MSKVHGSSNPESQGTPETQEAPEGCPLCAQGKPVRVQATGWADYKGAPVHDVDEYPGFRWCSAEDLPDTEYS